jgi:hypothetical protein
MAAMKYVCKNLDFTWSKIQEMDQSYRRGGQSCVRGCLKNLFEFPVDWTDWSVNLSDSFTGDNR